MDLGFLSGLLGGQGNSTLSMLLPLLFGGKMPDINGLLSVLNKGTREKQDGFPPLFGENEQRPAAGDGLFNMLGKMLTSAPANKNENAQASAEYPYELQYNRPQ